MANKIINVNEIATNSVENSPDLTTGNTGRAQGIGKSRFCYSYVFSVVYLPLRFDLDLSAAACDNFFQRCFSIRCAS